MIPDPSSRSLHCVKIRLFPLFHDVKNEARMVLIWFFCEKCHLWSVFTMSKTWPFFGLAWNLRLFCVVFTELLCCQDDLLHLRCFLCVIILLRMISFKHLLSIIAQCFSEQSQINAVNNHKQSRLCGPKGSDFLMNVLIYEVAIPFNKLLTACPCVCHDSQCHSRPSATTFNQRVV